MPMKSYAVDSLIGPHTILQRKESTISKTHLLSTEMPCTTCAGFLSTEQPTSSVHILSFSATVDDSESAWPPHQRGTGTWPSFTHSMSLVPVGLPLRKPSWKTQGTTHPPNGGQSTTKHRNVVVRNSVYGQLCCPKKHPRCLACFGIAVTWWSGPTPLHCLVST